MTGDQDRTPRPWEGQPYKEEPAPPSALRRTPSAPTPPFPAPGSIPHNAPTPVPVDRLRTVGHTPRPTAHPDGTPAPLPGRSRGQTKRTTTTSGSSGKGAVVQRFSGSGLTPEPKVRRRERSARRMTLALAIVMAFALVISATLLFDPSAFQTGFGLALGQRVSKITSDAPLVLSGTEPPTATAPGDASPTPTQQGSGSGAPTPTSIPPTATPVPPTATPVPPTPTPTPVNSNAATVTFAATTQNVSSQPATMSSCGSGCDIPGYSASNSQQFSGWHAATGYQAQASGTIHFYSVHCCVGFSGQVTIPQCNQTYTVNVVGQNNSPNYRDFSCTETGVTGVPAGTITGSQSGPGTEMVDWTNYTFSNTSYNYPTYNDCHVVLVNDDAQGDTWANNSINSWASAGGYTVTSRSINHGSYGCNPGVCSCNPAPNGVTGYSTTSFSATGFRVSDAQNKAASRIAPPAGYVWKSGPTTCTPSWSVSGSTTTITCQDTGVAVYNWTAALESQLAGALVNQTVAQAQKICDGTTGVSPPCQISVSGGNTNYMPSSASQIAIKPT